MSRYGHRHDSWFTAGIAFAVGVILFKLAFALFALLFAGVWAYTSDLPPVARNTIRGVMIVAAFILALGLFVLLAERG